MLAIQFFFILKHGLIQTTLNIEFHALDDMHTATPT